MTNTLKAKTIVITGASSGLGRAMAELLAKEESTLFLLSRSIESQEFSFPAIKINCDFKDSTSITQAFKKIDKTEPQIDVLINCVGIGLVKGLEDTTTEEVEDVISTNLVGTILACKEAYQRMQRAQSGHIVNVASTSGIKARPDETIYCASKWGMRGFTESLRLAGIKNKVRVTGIYPGGMKTDFWKIKPDQVIDAYMDPYDIAVQISNVIASPASISPSEIVLERGF